MKFAVDSFEVLKASVEESKWNRTLWYFDQDIKPLNGLFPADLLIALIVTLTLQVFWFGGYHGGFLLYTIFLIKKYCKNKIWFLKMTIYYILALPSPFCYLCVSFIIIPIDCKRLIAEYTIYHVFRTHRVKCIKDIDGKSSYRY